MRRPPTGPSFQKEFVPRRTPPLHTPRAQNSEVAPNPPSRVGPLSHLPVFPAPQPTHLTTQLTHSRPPKQPINRSADHPPPQFFLPVPPRLAAMQQSSHDLLRPQSRTPRLPLAGRRVSHPPPPLPLCPTPPLIAYLLDGEGGLGRVTRWFYVFVRIELIASDLMEWIHPSSCGKR